MSEVENLFTGSTTADNAADGTMEAPHTRAYSSDLAGLDLDDIATPILLLTQALSDVVQKGLCPIGKYWLAGQAYDSVTAIPLAYSKESGIDPFTNKPSVSIFFRVYVVEADVIASIRFKDSTLPAAREINAIAVQNKGYGRFAVTLGVDNKSKGKHSWKVPTITPAVVDSVIFDIANQPAF